MSDKRAKIEAMMAKKRAAEAPAAKDGDGEGLLGGIMGMFSQRDTPPAPAEVKV